MSLENASTTMYLVDPQTQWLLQGNNQDWRAEFNVD